MKLGLQHIRLHQPIFHFYSQEVITDVKNGVVVTHDGLGNRLGSIDRSGGVPHEEYDGMSRANARLLMPDSLERIEQKIDSLCVQFENSVMLNEKLVDSICKNFGNTEKVEETRVKPLDDLSARDMIS